MPTMHCLCLCLQLDKEQRVGGGMVSRLTGSVQSWMMSFIQAHGFGGILLLVRVSQHFGEACLRIRRPVTLRVGW